MDAKNQLVEKEFKEAIFRPWFLGIFGFAYFSQGFSLGSMALLFPLYINSELRAGSYSTSILVSIIMVSPWYFKFVFGILSDNFPIGKLGRRKPYLIIATVISMIGWLTIGLHTQVTNYFILSGFCIGLGSALADSVIDGLGVELTPIKFSGRLQGTSWGSRGLGFGMIGIVSTRLVDIYGWQTMFNVSAIFGIGLSVVALILPQIPYSKQNDKVVNIVKRSINQVLRQENIRFIIQFLIFSGVSIAIVPLLSILMEKEFSFDINRIGDGAVIFALGSFVGATVNGLISDEYDKPKVILSFYIIFAISLLSGLTLLIIESTRIQFIWIFAIGITTGAFEAYQLKIIMENSPNSYESTAFSIFTGFSNIAQFAFGGYIIVLLSETLNLSILIVMQLIVMSIVLTGIQVLHIKSSKSVSLKN